MKAYSEAAKGVKIDEEEDEESAAPAAATPTATPTATASPMNMVQVNPAPVQPRPQPRPLPPGVVKAMCFQCKRPFGVPVGAKMVACPHCQAVNQLAAAAGGV